MRAWRKRLATLGDVTAFDYPYMRAGRKTPDRLPALIAAHREVLAKVRARAKGPVFLIGKSMGGRVGCHVALEEDVAGIICLGYPLQSGATGAMRDEVLVALRTPILFVQGSRDALCPLDKLAAVRARMTAPSTLLVVEGGDHSLAVSAAQRKATGETQADSDARVLDAIGAFVTSTQTRSAAR
jgi:predicted alpha/beta-hydrolase family hydrolase